jgi:hypothetical protein
MTSKQTAIYPGQTWASRWQTGATVRITVVDGQRIGFTPNSKTGDVRYLTRARFLASYQRVRTAA